MELKTPTIKPCPFCGAEARGVVYWDDPNCDQWRISCSICPADMQLPVGAHKKDVRADAWKNEQNELIEAWNRREG